MALHLHGLFPGREVAAFHYRGYAPSTGRPSAQSLLSDAVLVFDRLQQAHAGERSVVAVGFSIGAGVAAYLARHRPVAGLVLVTPFDSLEALARDLYWWVPVGLLLRHRMPTIDFVRGSPVPTALVVAERDTIVPARRSMALRQAVGNLVFEAAVDAGHNDLYGRPAFAAAMREALARIEAASGLASGTIAGGRASRAMAAEADPASHPLWPAVAASGTWLGCRSGRCRGTRMSEATRR